MKQKIIKAIKHFAPIVLVALVLGIGIYNLNARLLLDDPIPMPFGIGASMVLTGSMEPEISAGDLIVVKETDEFYVDQIIVFRTGNTPTVHRIIAIDEETGMITTQGDANNTADDPITTDVIKGEVIFVVPYVGIVVDVLKHPLMTLMIVALAAWLMIRSFKKDESEQKSEDQDELERLQKEIDELTNELKK